LGCGWSFLSSVAVTSVTPKHLPALKGILLYRLLLMLSDELACVFTFYSGENR